MIDSKHLRLTALLSIALLPTATFANDKTDIGKVTVEDESEEIKLTHTPMPVSVIDAERFHGRNISLNEVLKRVAGVKVSQQGGLGSKSTVAIHGLEGKRVKIFIDGSPLNAPDGSLGINDLPIQVVKRIEIYKGVVPAKFGGDALGGAVNVVTREYNGDWIDLNLSVGSFATQRMAAVLTKEFPEHKFKLGGGVLINRAKNDYEMQSPHVDDLTIKRDHDAYAHDIFAVGMTWEDRWFDKIKMELIRLQSEKEIQGIETNIQQAKTKSSANVVAIELEKDHFLTDNLLMEYSFVRPVISSQLIDKATSCVNFDNMPRTCPGAGGETDGIPHDSDDETAEFRHDINFHYPINQQHALNFHLNHRDVEFTPSDPLASQELGYAVGDFPSERQTTVTAVSYEANVMDGKLLNDMGIKHYDYDYSIVAQERSLSGTPQRTNSSGNESGFYESIRYSPIKGLFLKGSYEHAYRLPDNNEAFGDGVSITTSPNLAPEEAKNLNLGVLFDRFDVYGMPWLKAEANYFRRDLTNMIKLVSGPQRSRYQNLGEVEVEGFEFEVKADITNNWYAYINYTDQTLTDKQKTLPGSNTPNPTYGLDVPNVANRFGNVGFEYKTLGLGRPDSMLKLFWETSWADEYYYGWELSKNQSRKIDAQTSHTAGAEYSFQNDEIILGFEVRNLTDETITDVFNHPLMGRSYHLNLRYTWFQ